MAELLNPSGEEEGGRSLGWRSQHALALALFRGTPAGKLLASHKTD